MKVETQTQTTKTYTLHLTSQEAEDLRTLLHLAVSTLSTALPAKLVERAVPKLSDRGNVMHRALVDRAVQIDDSILHVEDELRLRLLEEDSPAPARVAVESRQPASRGWEVQFYSEVYGIWRRSNDIPGTYTSRYVAYKALRTRRKSSELSYRVARVGDYANTPGHYELEAVIGGKWKRVPCVHLSESSAHQAACRFRNNPSMVDQWRTVFVKK